MDHRRCHFAALARVPLAQGIPGSDDFCSDRSDAGSNDDALWILREDLMVAMSAHHLHVFARKLKNLSCSCRQDPRDTLLANGFHCPHLIEYDDYCYFSAIPFRSIAQVLITYRTATISAATRQETGVAARTKDLILKFADTSQLWLEFEHNLARGTFLEALTLSYQQSVSPGNARGGYIDVEYVDLNEVSSSFANTPADLVHVFPAVPISDAGARASPRKTRSTMLQELFLSSDPEGEERTARFVFVRDAFRHVVYDKVLLALQIARETSMEDPSCGFLLATAKEVSQALDEPDLNAFTWLSSGFINMQSDKNHCADKQELAFAQAAHAIDVARANGFPYLLSLALHCAADLHFRRTDFTLAKEFLVEAAWLTPEGVELPMKMQMHRKIHDLRKHTATTMPSTTSKHWSAPTDWTEHDRQASGNGSFTTSVSSEGYKVDMKPQTAFNLWTHCMGARSSSVQQQPRTHDPVTPSFKDLLLQKVFKLPPPGVLTSSVRDFFSSTSRFQRSGSCIVEILEHHHKAASRLKAVRLRVFFDCCQTFEWLRREVMDRMRLFTPPSPDTVSHAESIGSFRVPHHHQEPIAWRKRLGDVLTMDDQVLLAHLELEAVPVTGSGSPASVKPRHDELSQQRAEPMVTCSVCHSCIALDDVEGHSETCC